MVYFTHLLDKNSHKSLSLLSSLPPAPSATAFRNTSFPHIFLKAKVKLHEKCSGTPHVSDIWNSALRQKWQSNMQWDRRKLTMSWWWGNKRRSAQMKESIVCVHWSSGSSQGAEQWRRDDGSLYFSLLSLLLFPQHGGLIRCDFYVFIGQIGFKKQSNPHINEFLEKQPSIY